VIRLLFLFCLPVLSLPGSGRQVEREVYLMGTILKITSYAQSRERGLREMEAVVRVIEQTEEEISNWRPESEFSQLNSHPVGIPFSLSPSTCVLMQKLDRWVKSSHGAFDPAVGKLVQIWGIQGDIRIPDAAAIDAALAESGFSHINLNPRKCAVTKTGMVLLDSGAFGKGEALDRVVSLAKKENYAPMVLNFGGQVAVWRMPSSIDIANPSTRKLSSGKVLQISYGSLSTSGQSEHARRIEGKEIGHILDPATGWPVADFGSVTVWSPSALDADVLSTALYVMGPKKGFDWATRNGVKACFLEKKGDLHCNYETENHFHN